MNEGGDDVKIKYVQVGHRQYEFTLEANDGSVVEKAFIAAVARKFEHSPEVEGELSKVEYGPETWAGPGGEKAVLRFRW